MSKFTMETSAMLQILNEEQIKQIHESALKILDETGVRFDSDRALGLLESKGCRVDHDTKMVHFPRELVEQAIQQAPEQFDMYNCAGEKTLRLGQGHSYFGAGPGNPSILDASGEKRTGKMADLGEALAIVQQSKYLDIATGSIVPDDCPPGEGADLYILYQAMKKTGKTILAETWEDDSVDKVCTLLETVKGSRDAFAEKPFIILSACPVPPMKWDERTIDISYRCVEYGIPLLISSSPILGVTAPVTLAGGVLQHTVETLSYITFVQMIHPGAPVFYGGICGTMDMRTTYSSHSAVEACLCTAGYAAMAHYYGIPCLAFLAQTDAKVPDYQAGFETAMGALVSTLSGIDVIYGAGVVDSYSCTSHQKLIMDSQLFGYIKMFGEGIQVDEETLGVEEIQEVCCGDEETHMQREFTLDWYRESQCMTEEVIDRSSYATWQATGKDIQERAAIAIQKSMVKYDLDPELEEKIERGYQAILAQK